MWTDTTENRAFVTELSKEIVAEVAPEELALFDQLVTDYYQNPAPPDLTHRADDDALGFGLGEVLTAASPAATAMVSAVLGFVMQQAINAFHDESSDFIRSKVKGLFKRDKDKDQPSAGDALPFTRQQLKQARELALQEATRYGMEQAEAERMADALLRRLALGD
jgi:hypothetical protein